MTRLLLVAIVAVGWVSPVAAKGFVWAEHPSLKDVPADGVHGSIGAPVELKQIVVKSDDRGWRIELKDSAAFMALGPSVLVSDDLVVGKEFRKEIKGGSAGTTLQMKNAKGESSTLNTENAWVVQLSAWNVKPWAKGLTDAGTASGRIAVVFRGGAWAAGTFKDVPVKYDRHPPLCALSCVIFGRYSPAKASVGAGRGKPVKLAWSATPNIAMAPPTLSAELDGKKVVPTDVSFTGNDKGWYLTLQAKDGEKTIGTSIRLGEMPIAGARYTKTMSAAGDAALDVSDHSDASNTTSMPGQSAYVIEITAFSAKPWDDSMRNNTTEAGKVSGRVVAMWKGDDGYKNSWIAGTFTDVTVEYYRDPPLCAATCQ